MLDKLFCLMAAVNDPDAFSLNDKSGGSVVENHCGCRDYQDVHADACFQSLHDQNQLPLAVT